MKFVGFAEGMDIFAYDEWFYDPITDTEIPLVPEKKILIGSTNARAERLYGAIHHVKAGWAAMARFPWTWEDDDPGDRYVQLHSAPLISPHQVDAFYVATVLP